MDNQKVNQFSVIGISVRTTNENGQAAQDIPALWNMFMTNQIADNIPAKIDNTVYCIYTDYEKDHTRPYTAIIGCRVSELTLIPHGMIGKTFPEAAYTKIVAKGNNMQGMVFNEWTKIWNSDIDRAYTADFEVYGERAQHVEAAEVDIFIAVKS